MVDSDIDDLEVVRSYRDEHNGITHVYFRQTVQGIEVLDGTAAAHIRGVRDVVAISSHVVPRARERVNTFEPTLSQEDALWICTVDCDLGNAPASPKVTEEADDASLRKTFDLPAIARGPVPVQLKFAPLGEELRLCWSVKISRRDGADSFERLYDAVDGEELSYRSFVAHATPEFKVFPLADYGNPTMPPVESPAHGSQTRVIDGSDPTFVLPSTIPTPSPHA